jgi:hypothetical protein
MSTATGGHEVSSRGLGPGIIHHPNPANSASYVPSLGVQWVHSGHPNFSVEALYASGISEALNCTAFFTLIGAPAALVIAHLRRKPRDP